MHSPHLDWVADKVTVIPNKGVQLARDTLKTAVAKAREMADADKAISYAVSAWNKFASVPAGTYVTRPHHTTPRHINCCRAVWPILTWTSLLLSARPAVQKVLETAEPVTRRGLAAFYSLHDSFVVSPTFKRVVDTTSESLTWAQVMLWLVGLLSTLSCLFVTCPLSYPFSLAAHTLPPTRPHSVAPSLPSRRSGDHALQAGRDIPVPLRQAGGGPRPGQPGKQRVRQPGGELLAPRSCDVSCLLPVAAKAEER